MTDEVEQPAEPLSGLFSRDPGEKLRRKRQLLDALHGQPQSPRDDAGRFAERGDFDGGARKPAPERPQTHSDWLGAALRDRSLDVGKDL